MTAPPLRAVRYDRSSLRVLGCVGEPLNQEAWQWYNDVIGDKRCSVIDTWWQTGELQSCGDVAGAWPGLGRRGWQLYASVSDWFVV